MFEDVEAAAEGAVAPEVAAAPFPPLVPLDVLHDDGLRTEADAPHAVEAVEAEGDELALGVFVADDEYGEAAGLEEVVTVSGGRVTNAETIGDLKERGKWESSLWKAEAYRPFMDDESRSARHLDESLGWSEGVLQGVCEDAGGAGDEFE